MITDKLLKKLNGINYPGGIISVKENRIEGKAFFPGGDGLLFKDKKFPKGGIMILGQDFDNECNFIDSVNRGGEEKNNTWRNLEEILNDNNIPTQICFFTNAIMGLREGNKKNTGRSIAFKKDNKEFLCDCRKFFLTQVDFQKPKLIIGLGAHIPKFLSETTDDLKDLSEITSLSKIGKSNKENIRHVKIGGYKIIVIFITHPSMYHVNVIKRHPKGKIFEYSLIKAAYNAAFNG